MSEIYANNARATLAEDIGTSDTTVMIQPDHTLPALAEGDWFRLTLFQWEFYEGGVREFRHEVVKVTGFASDTLTIERAIEGAALSHESGTSAELRPTAGTVDAVRADATSYTDTHEAKTGGIHGIPEGERAVHTADFTRRGGAEFPLILVQDPLRQAVEAETGGRMTVLYDAAGNPNYMHVVPRFRYEDLGFDDELGAGDVTAFDTGTGSIKPEIFIGAYQASSDGGNAVSQPFKNPWVDIDWDDSKAACDAMGAGWHMMTVHEWAAVALWCVANGFEPRGNTNHGRAHDATWEVGRRQDGDTYPPGDSDGVGYIYAGSGPATWRHNGDLSGIADLVGNVWEWLWGAKIQDGRIHAVADNDTSVAESDWQDTGVDITGAVSWTSSSVEGTELTDRILFTYAGIDLKGRLYVDDEGERVPRRGGFYGTGSNAGLAALSLGSARSEKTRGIGFRPSYIPQ